MGSPSELSLDLKPHNHSMLLKSFASSGEHQLAELKQLEDFLACLEDERLKVEAFKRELPLCMQLLSNAVETSRKKLHAVKSINQGERPVLEEFIPLKSPAADGEADMDSATTKTDKSNWMVSAQLWSQTPNTDNNSSLAKQHDDQTNMGLNMNSYSTMSCTLQRNSNLAGAFVPFSKKDKLALDNSQKEHDLLEEKKLLRAELISDYSPSNMITRGGMLENEPIKAAAETLTTSNNTTHQTNRKARRCWSPDLHRKFVNALQMLGGSQVATPKQIRELMKVDGLTNDEVKSHLQKYRLHTRRPSPSPPTQHSTPSTPAAAQLVVLGGLWVPPEYAAHHHNGPLYQNMGPDFYNAAGVQNQHRQQMFQIHQHQQMQIQMHQQQMQAAIDNVKKQQATAYYTSPGDQSESIDEDGKSESGSWNSSGKERMMKGGEGDRESETITLKF